MNRFMTMTPVAARLTGISGRRQTKIMEKTMRTLAYVFASVALAGFFATSAQAKSPIQVNCNSGKNNNIQAAVDAASPGDTIFISGTCEEDVSITKDDITLSGNQAGGACIRATPGGTGTINGTVTVDGVRARIEFLTITGSGVGVVVTNRADARLTCNDISSNQESGILVFRTSNAVLKDNTVSSNGQRSFDRPFIFFDVGLSVAGASAVRSEGNTYADNQYAAIEADRQATFRNGSFLPREAGHPPIAGEKDTIIAKGSDPATPDSCKTDNDGPIAVSVFNNGHAEFRNADICGFIETVVNSTMRIDDAGGEIIGNVSAGGGSFVRIRDRSGDGDGRLTTFDGTLTCTDGSQTFGSNVQCGETCSGAIPGTCSSP